MLILSNRTPSFTVTVLLLSFKIQNIKKHGVPHNVEYKLLKEILRIIAASLQMHFNQIHNILYKINCIHVKEHNKAQYKLLIQCIKHYGMHEKSHL
jgi:hypothetical protein